MTQLFHECNSSDTGTCTSESVIHFKAWAELAQQWLVCASLGIHIEPINKE